MPFYVSVPLPGPLRWSHRPGGPHRRRRRGRASRWRSPLYWLTGLALLELSVWLLWGCVWLLAAAAQYGWQLARAGIAAYRRR
jgi:hypothetical protein